MDEDSLPQRRSAALDQLEREELDPFSREELARRIDRLEAEIKRCRRALDAKSNVQDAAAALFRR